MQKVVVTWTSIKSPGEEVRWTGQSTPLDRTLQPGCLRSAISSKFKFKAYSGVIKKLRKS